MVVRREGEKRHLQKPGVIVTTAQTRAAGLRG